MLIKEITTDANWTVTGSSGTTEHSASFISDEEHLSVSSVSTPGWRKKLQKGEIINNPYLRIFSSLILPPSTWSYSTTNPISSGGWTVNMTGAAMQFLVEEQHGVTFNHIPVITDEPNDDLIMETVAKIDQSPYAFMEDLLEIKKTGKFVKNAANNMNQIVRGGITTYRKELAKLAKDRKKGKISTKRYTALVSKSFASYWLEVRYGLRPLLISAQNALEVSQKRKYTPNPRRTARQSRTDNYEATEIFSLRSNIKLKKVTQVVRKRKCTIMYHISNPASGLDAELGLRMKDIPATMWFIFPYTWLSDRVLDIGTSIQAITAFVNPEMKILMGCISSTTTTTTSFELITQGQPEETIQSNSVSGLGSLTTVVKQRTPISVDASNLLPSFNLSVDNYANAFDTVAVALQSVKKR